MVGRSGTLFAINLQWPGEPLDKNAKYEYCHQLNVIFGIFGHGLRGRRVGGSNPMRRAQTKTVPFRGPFPIQWWAMRDVRVRLAPPAPRFVAPLLACCAGKRFAFPQLRTLSGSNPMRWAQTKTVPFRGPFPIQWWAMRDSNPQPCACKAPALTVAPIARAERV